MNEQIIALKKAAPYIRLYRNKTFVIKLGGAVMDGADTADSVAEQCALLSDLGIRLVLVHGGSVQASRISRILGATPRFVAGRRVTDATALEAAKMAYAGSVNVDLVCALRRHGARSVGCSGIDAGTVVADRRPPVTVIDDDGEEKQVDFGHVGDIRAVDTALLLRLLADDFMPVVCCLASDEAGNVLNINADIMAEALAVALKAKKLIFITDRPGLLRDAEDDSSLVPFADAADLADLLESGAVTGGMRPKVEACIRAAEDGVKRTHIISGKLPKSLLVEIFTGEGCGTMIVGRREKEIQQELEHG